MEKNKTNKSKFSPVRTSKISDEVYKQLVSMISDGQLRPGEKLHEELITEGEGIVPTNHEKIMVLRGDACDQVPLNGKIDELGRLAREQHGEAIRSKLQEILPEYSPATAGEQAGVGLGQDPINSQKLQPAQASNEWRVDSGPPSISDIPLG